MMLNCTRLLVSMIVVLNLISPVLADDRLGGLIRGLKRTIRGGKEMAVERSMPNSCTHPNVEELAGQIDWLEHHLELYGSAVAKQPNIWGEARLTRHRQEIETELASKVSAFSTTFQAALSRADSAATALNATINNPANAPSASATATATATTNQALSIEPGIENQQLFRYLNSLNTLRRINEGDDIADTPGYAMNLLRVPVSVLPGKRTRQGYGADISMTVHPQLDEHLLPKTFRSLVINDQVDQLSLSMVRLIEGKRGDEKFPRHIEKFLQYAEAEHLAGQTITLMEQRLSAIADSAPGNGFSQRCRDIQEYLRARIIHIFQLAGAPTTTQVPIVSKSLDAFDVELRVNYNRLRRLLPILFTEGCGILDLDLTLQLTGKERISVPVSIFVSEVTDFTKLHEASLPYIFWIPFGPVDASQLESLTGKEFTPELLCKLQSKGMLHLEAVSRLLNDDPNFLREDASIPLVLQYGLERLAEIDGFCPLPIDEQKLVEIVQQIVLPATIPPAKDVKPGEEAPSVSGLDIAQPLQFVGTRRPINRSEIQPSSCDPLSMIGPATRTLIKDTASSAWLEFIAGVTKQLPTAIQEQLSKLNTAPHPGSQQIVKLEVRKIVSIWNNAVYEISKQQAMAYGGALYFGSVSESIAQSGQINSSTIGTGFAFHAASALRSRKATHPLAPSVQVSVLGSENLALIARALDEALKFSPQNGGEGRLLIDVRTFLHDELQSAYDLLSSDELLHSWQYGYAHLSDSIQGHNWAEVRRLREDYQSRLPVGIAGSVAGALGWGLIVESSLLNERLISDIQAQSAKSGLDVGDVSGFCFWGPRPPVQSCEIFNQYVMAKWPIQVFALDPISQDQNINDAYSVARDLQVSIAAAASAGQVPIGIAGSFARNLQLELDSIAINRTAVGYSHGSNNFGWRFYPRVQTPATPGTLGAFGQTLFGGPTRDTLIRQRRLEPGIRECVAMVIMPSFIENVSISSRSSWFHLMNPADKELTVTDAMNLSSAQQGIRNFLHCAKNCNCYRAGDVAHLTDILGQLEERLPLQATTVQTPHENSLGGYELLDSGVSGLAPDLVGWYGAPGIDPSNPTKLFLVGQGFSVHQTRVIAGGREIPYKLISREIMEVTVPPGVQPLGNGVRVHQASIDFHVATPYGVSSHLLVPQVAPNVANPTAKWNPGSLRLELILKAPQAADEDPSAEKIGVWPSTVLGVSSPISSLGSSGNINLDLFTNSQAGVTRVGAATVPLTTNFDRATQRYVVQPYELSSLLTAIQTYVLEEAKAGRITPADSLFSLKAKGNLEVPATGAKHPIAGTFPIQVNLTWK